MTLERLLRHNPRAPEPGVRVGAVETFLAAIAGLTRPEARERLRGDARLYRWNATTQGACLRALRERFDV
jgi:hypothetical protein